jgi:hypothetical protein
VNLQDANLNAQYDGLKYRASVPIETLPTRFVVTTLHMCTRHRPMPMQIGLGIFNLAVADRRALAARSGCLDAFSIADQAMVCAKNTAHLNGN